MKSTPSARRWTILAIAPLLAAVLTSTAARGQAPNRWQIRGFYAYGSTGSGWSLTEGGEFIEIEPDTIDGWGLGLDYRFSPRLALELGYLDTDVDTSVRVALQGIQADDRFDIGFRPFTLGLGIHLLAGAKVDLVLSPQLAWIDYGDPLVDLPEIDSVDVLTLDDEVSWGLGLRLDVPLGNWMVNLGIDYYDATANVTNADVEPDIRIAIDPWILRVGVGYRF